MSIWGRGAREDGELSPKKPTNQLLTVSAEKHQAVFDGEQSVFGFLSIE